MCPDLSEASTKLNQNQLLAAQMLAEGKSGREVAKSLSITPETVSRWRRQYEFEKHLNTLCNEVREDMRNRWRELKVKAIAIAEKNIDAPSLPPKDRFFMALKILDMYL